MGERNDILSEHKDRISEEDLLKYLDKNISETEMNALEEKASENNFEKEALEGLQLIETEKIKSNVHFLNQKLHQQLQGKKYRIEKVKFNNVEWWMLTLLILLFICILGFFIIKMQTGTSY